MINYIGVYIIIIKYREYDYLQKGYITIFLKPNMTTEGLHNIILANYREHS